MPAGSTVTLGRVYDNARWAISAGNAKYPKLMSAIKFVANSILRLPNVLTARVFVGARTIPSITARSSEHSYVVSTLLTWTQTQTNFETHQQDCYNGVAEKVYLAKVYEDWENVRCIQLLSADVPLDDFLDRSPEETHADQTDCQPYSRTHMKTA